MALGRRTRAGDLVEQALVLDPGCTTAEALSRFRAEGRGLRHAAVCENGRLAGLLEISTLLTADLGTTVGELALPAGATIHTSATAERAAFIAAHSHSESVAVTDHDGQFAGVIPAQRLLPLIVHEHEVDLARLGGFLRGTRRARTASEEPLLQRVWHRAPWLLVGLAGAVLAAQIVRSFESELQNTLALAFFLPGIVYMADAVGTQTETLVIRGISVGVSMRQIFRLEVLTGAVVGLILSVAVFPFALLLTGEVSLAVTVALSLMASASCATIVAMCLPWLLHHLNFDPAFGSGPLATVIQDLLSIVIYFSIGIALLS